jgi:hypothetical protein
VCGLALLYKNRARIRGAHLLGLIGLNATGVLTMIVSPELPSLYAEEVKGYLQWSYSLTIAYGFYLEAAGWSADFLRKLFGWAVVVILVGCALEVYTPFVVVSDAFRYSVYNRYIYDAAERDLVIANHARPKLFTQEPSYVSLFFAISLIGWYYLSKWKLKNIGLLAFSVAALYLLRTPTLLAAAPAIVMAQFVDVRGWDGREAFRRARLQRIFAKMAAVPLFLFVIIFLSSYFFNNRFAFDTDDLDQSTQLRITGPYRIALSTLANYPIFGVGIGATETIEEDLYREAMNIIGDSKFVNSLPVNGIVCNSFCELLIFFGLLGTAAALYFGAKIVKFMGCRRYLFVAVNQFALMNVQGAFVGPRVWSYFAILLVVCEVKGRSRRPAVAGPASIGSRRLEDLAPASESPSR